MAMKKYYYIRPLLLIAILCATLDGFLYYQMLSQHLNNQRVDVSLRLATLRARLEKEITANLLLVQGMANFISVTPALTPQVFTQYARETLQDSPVIRNLGAAPDYVMRYVYPMEGNEAVLGVSYRDLPEQWETASRTERTGELIVDGPLQLVQGGTGIIGRAPVFMHEKGQRRFWGVVSSVIDADRLYDMAGMRDTTLKLALRAVNEYGQEGPVFWGQPDLFEPKIDAVRMPVTFPSGNWVLAGTPEHGWSHTPPLAFMVHGLVLLLFLVSGFAAYRAARRNHLIEQTRESLNHAQALARLGSWDADMRNGDLWWSDETFRILGTDREEHTPSLRGFMDMVHPDDRELVEARFADSLRSCGSYSVDHRIVLADGTVRHVQERGKTECDDMGSPIRSTGTIQDITDRKLIEDALKANEAQMRAMAEASHDALIMIDSDDRVMFWSPAAERMFGWTRKEALGRSLHLLVTQESDREKAWKGLKHFATTGQGPVVGSVMEFMAVKKGGELFPVERSVAAFRLGDSYYAVGSLRDITQRRKAEQDLRAFSDRLELASRAGGIGVWEWNIKDDSLIWDKQMLAIYKIRDGEFSGLYEAWKGRVHPEDIAAAHNAIQEAGRSASPWEWEFRIIWPDGSVRHVRAAALTRRDAQGQPEFMVGVNWDVTESRRLQEQLHNLATTDALTGLANRRWFMERTEGELERCSRYGSPFSLIMFDADKFKSVNDTYGHDAGDMVLKAIAEAARSVLREVDILGRLGGEEFAIGLPETAIEGGRLVAERVRLAIQDSGVELEDGTTVRFTVSLGVAEYSEDCSSLEALLKQADAALYRAKQNGRNRVECALVPPVQ